MQLSTLFKVVAAMIVMTILTCTLIIVNHHFGGAKKSKNKSVQKIANLAPEKEEVEIVEIDMLRRRISQKNRPEIVLGAPALRKAKQVLLKNDFKRAKVLLEDIVTKYEDTPAELEAYRILGEMNMDEIFEIREDDPRFITYTVKSGDTYFGIIKKHETNFDLMMLINDMTSNSSNGLRPGQKLLLMPLHFSLRIVPHKNQLFLLDKQGAVVKMYEPVIDMTIPKKKERLDSFVGKVSAYYKGSVVNPTRGNYRESDKSIKITGPSIEIIGETSSIPSSFKGIVLSKQDMEELVLLIRSGNKVEILY